MKNLIKINESQFSKNMKKPAGFSRFDDKKIQKNEKLMDVEFLMREEKIALRLHIDNLVLTYGIDAVNSALSKTDLNTIRKAKRKAG